MGMQVGSVHPKHVQSISIYKEQTMKIVNSYLVKLSNGTTAWLPVGKEPIGEVLEVRPVIMPDDGMVLRHKTTGDISGGRWLREGSEADWEEIPEPKEGE